MTNDFLVPFSALFGLIFGSFINVVALRDENRLSILKDRSQCPHCKHTLAWYDLIPLLSFLMVGGKCHYCRKAISWRYPLVELVAAVLVVITWQIGFIQYGSVLVAVGLMICALLLLATSLIDLQSLGVPLEYVVAAGVIGSFSLIISGNLSFIDAIRGLAIGAGSLAFIMYGWKAAFHQDGMGSGDLWIAGALGATLGYPGILVALMSAIFAGAILGSVFALVNRKGFGSAIPFGPFLSIGWVIALVWGQSIIAWYILGL